MEVELECAHPDCDGSGEDIKTHDPAAPDSIVYCDKCGTEYGTWGEVQAEVMEAAKSAVERDATSAGLKINWK